VLAPHRDERVSSCLSGPRAVRHWKRGVVILHGDGILIFRRTPLRRCGDGIKADVILKATRVDGVTTPIRNRFRTRNFLPRLSYREVLNQNLKVMDATGDFAVHGQRHAGSWCSYEPRGKHNLRVVLGERWARR